MERGHQAAVQIDLLGPLQVRLDGVDVDVGGPKAQAILMMLAHHVGETVGVDALFEALWGEEPPASARNAIQVRVSGLRKLLDQSLDIQKTSAGYVLATTGVSVDASSFEHLVHSAEACLNEDPARALEVVDSALAIWRGTPAAAELDLQPLQGQLAALSEVRARAQLTRLDARLQLGDHLSCCLEAQGLVDEHPYREDFRARHMLALYRSGRQVEALAAFRQARELLVEELGVEPGPQLQALHRQVLAQDPDLDQEDSLDTETTTAEASLSRDNLRAEPNALVGRPETEAVLEVLEPGRVVTIVGTGGLGKSRCVNAVARRCLTSGDFEDGVWIVDLAPLPANSDDVAQSAATAMGLGSEPSVSPLETVVGYLRGRRALIVIDNCEHVADSAAAFAHAIAAKTAAAVIAASRVRLGLLAEKVVTLEPLPDDEARLLLEARVSEAGAGPFSDDDYHALCVVLDNYPLAIELAAARTRSMGPREIAERIAKQPQLLASHSQAVDGGRRHTDLAAALDWSLQQLSPRSRATLERAAIFVSDFDLTTAEAVLATNEINDAAVVEDLGELVEQQLVGRDHGRARFRILEPIRQHLRHAASTEIGRSYSDHFASFAVEAAKGLRGPDEALWWNRWRADLPHVREVVRLATEQGDIALLEMIMEEMAVTIAICAVIEPGEWAITAFERLGRDPLEMPGVAAAAAAKYVHLRQTEECDALLGQLLTIDDSRIQATVSCIGLYRYPMDDSWGRRLYEHAKACDDRPTLVLAKMRRGDRDAVDLADAYGNPSLSVFARQWRSALHLTDRRSAESRRNKEEIYRIALTSNNEHTIAEGQMFMALQHCFDDDPRRAGPLCVEMLERMIRVRSDQWVWHGIEVVANMLAMVRMEPFASETLWAAVTATGHLPFSRVTREERLPVWVASQLTDDERSEAHKRGSMMDMDEAAREARKAAERMSL